MADDSDATPDNVVPLYTKALLPRRIPAGRFADAMRALRDDLRGSLREDGTTARIALIFERFMWMTARGDDLNEIVFPTATELALALIELDDEIAELRKQPATAVNPERVSQIEHDFVAAQSALEVERARNAENRVAHDERVAALTRELESERAARATAERMRLDEFRGALTALRAESASAAQANAALTGLVAQAGAARDAITIAINAMGVGTTADGSLNLTARRATLAVRQRILDEYLEQVDDLLGQVAEELAVIPDEKGLDEMQRTGGARLPERIRAEVAAHRARRQQLEAYAEKLIALKRPLDEERNRIQAILNAIEVIANPIPEQAVLAAIPLYPDPPAQTDSAEAADHVGATTHANRAEPAADPDESATPAPIVVRLMVVLYDAIARAVDYKQYTVSRVMKSAEQAGILRQFRCSRYDFFRAVSSEANWEPESKVCLRFRGTLIRGNPSLHTYQRTNVSVPIGWTTLVSADEERAFLDAFRAFAPHHPGDANR